LGDAFSNYRSSTDSRLTSIENTVESNRKTSSAGVAQALAASQATNTPAEPGTHQMGAALGYYDNQPAIAVGFNGTRVSGNSSYSGVITSSGGNKHGVAVGARWKF
jgi:hypothetical protein